MAIELKDKSFVRVLGVRINIVDYAKTLLIIKECIINQSLGNYICFSPVHPIMVSQRDLELKRALENSLLTVPDGMPVVWAAKLLGGTISDRVYGPNMTLRVCEEAEKSGFSIFLYGSHPHTLEKMRNNLLSRFRRLRVIGAYSPPFRNLSSSEEREVIQMIKSASPNILFVGLGAPKQEKWMAHYCPKLDVPISLGVGAAFDFLSGEKRQAPAWMQTRGLEWFYRLMCEPRRLGARYLIYNPLFMLNFLNQLLYHKIKH
jgi:N-acetylglucosaminyldiphosphoundecaprenol N-acetyl-beta-D-mannosaminyltransferase